MESLAQWREAPVHTGERYEAEERWPHSPRRKALLRWRGAGVPWSRRSNKDVEYGEFCLEGRLVSVGGGRVSLL